MSTPCSFKACSHNLALLSTLQASTPFDSLVTNLKETRIYHLSSWQGKCWKRLYNLWSVDERFGYNKFSQTVFHTQVAFKRQASLLTEQINQYELYFKNACEGYSPNEAGIEKERRAILEWYQLAHSALKILYKRKAFFTQFFALLNPSISFSSFETSLPSPSLAKFKNFRKIIAIQSFCEGRFPFAALERITKGKTSSPNDDRTALKKWAKQLNESALREPTFNAIRLLHQALIAFIKEVLLECKPEDILKSLFRIEILLKTHGCQLFGQRDPKQLLWRNQLKSGSSLSNYVIGERIGEKAAGGDADQIHVYTLANEPNKLLLTGINRAIFGLEQSCGIAWTIPTRKICEYDPKSRFIIAERLLTPLKKHQWCYKKSSLTKTDKALLDQLDLFIQQMEKEKKIPEELSINDLMLDENGTIKFFKSKGIAKRFHLLDIESFAWDLSQKDPHIFSLLMRNLKKNQMAQFYREKVSDALEGRAPLEENSEEKDRIEALKRNVRQLRHNCHEKLLTYFQERKPEEFCSELNEAILQAYDKSNGIYLLVPTLQAEVVKALTPREKKKAKESSNGSTSIVKRMGEGVINFFKR